MNFSGHPQRTNNRLRTRSVVIAATLFGFGAACGDEELEVEETADTAPMTAGESESAGGGCDEGDCLVGTWIQPACGGAAQFVLDLKSNGSGQITIPDCNGVCADEQFEIEWSSTATEITTRVISGTSCGMEVGAQAANTTDFACDGDTLDSDGRTWTRTANGGDESCEDEGSSTGDPVSDPYDSCESNVECNSEFFDFCRKAESGYSVCGGVCSDDSECPNRDGAHAVCVPYSDTRVCILACDFDVDCPTGMQCYGQALGTDGSGETIRGGACAWPEPGSNCAYGYYAVAYDRATGEAAVEISQDAIDARQVVEVACPSCTVEVVPEETDLTRCVAVAHPIDDPSRFWRTSRGGCDLLNDDIIEAALEYCESESGTPCTIAAAACAHS